jgi:lipopolysaccharide export system permease protein
MERIRGGKVQYNLRADAMRWDTAKRKWSLNNAVERTIDTMQERVVTHKQLYINLNLKPADLRRDERMQDKMTTPELLRFIKGEEERGIEGLNTLKVEQHRRSATPFTVLMLTMIGAVVAGRKTRGGSGLHLAIGIGIAAVFILSDRFSTVFSTKRQPAALIAAWIPTLCSRSWRITCTAKHPSNHCQFFVARAPCPIPLAFHPNVFSTKN